MTTHLKTHIEKSVNEITDRGCTIPKEILTNYFDTAIALAQATPDDYIGKLITEPESEFIKPEQMIKGNWYYTKTDKYGDWIFMFDSIIKNDVFTNKSIRLDTKLQLNFYGNQGRTYQFKDLRPATQSEVLKYFPNETFNETKDTYKEDLEDMKLRLADQEHERIEWDKQNNQTQEYGC